MAAENDAAGELWGQKELVSMRPNPIGQTK